MEDKGVGFVFFFLFHLLGCCLHLGLQCPIELSVMMKCSVIFTVQ